MNQTPIDQTFVARSSRAPRRSMLTFARQNQAMIATPLAILGDRTPHL